MAKKDTKNSKDYRTFNDELLDITIEEEAIRLKKTKFSHAVNPIENPLAIKQLRKNIARLKTEQRKRELGL